MSTFEFNTNSKLILDNLENGLKLVLQQRNCALTLNQYEKAAQLRDVEKTLIEIQAKLIKHRLPAYLDQYHHLL